MPLDLEAVLGGISGGAGASKSGGSTGDIVDGAISGYTGNDSNVGGVVDAGVTLVKSSKGKSSGIDKNGVPTFDNDGGYKGGVGVALGGAIGSIIPGVGTAVGALVGALVDGIAVMTDKSSVDGHDLNKELRQSTENILKRADRVATQQHTPQTIDWAIFYSKYAAQEFIKSGMAETALIYKMKTKRSKQFHEIKAKYFLKMAGKCKEAAQQAEAEKQAQASRKSSSAGAGGGSSSGDTIPTFSGGKSSGNSGLPSSGNGKEVKAYIKENGEIQKTGSMDKLKLKWAQFKLSKAFWPTVIGFPIVLIAGVWYVLKKKKGSTRKY